MKPRVSVVINTFNEEKNLPYVLRSVRTWADEIIVVDMHSEDRTVEIAKEYGAKVFLFERVGFVEPARKFAVEQTTSEWIFILDADELIPQPLSVTLMDIAAKDAADVVVIPWLNYVLGAPILHSGHGPHQARHTRFFKNGKVELSAQVHSGIHSVLNARVLTLPYHGENTAVVHFNAVDCAHLISKLNSYTTIEALQARDRNESSTYSGMLWAAFREFVSRYIRSKGYKDGWRGFYFAVTMILYRVTAGMKLRELEETGGHDEIVSHYQREAERMLAAYKN